MNIYSPKDGREVFAAWVEELIPGSPEGVCMIDKEPHINSICNIGYACDACPYNDKNIQEWAKRMASELPGVSVWTSYVGLSLAEQVLARQNFGENVRNILYNFRGMKAIECDNDGRVVDIVA